MKTSNALIGGAVSLALILVALQVFGMPGYFGWALPSGMGMNAHAGQGNGCQMNGQAMMGPMMNGQSMNHQSMGRNSNQMMNGQYHQQQCVAQMGQSHNMTAEQCQAMH